MKITKTADEVKLSRARIKSANAGCDVCPCCGETKSSMEHFRSGELSKGIVSGLSRTWVTGFFKIKHMKCDCYMCLTCGAKWESDPYEW